VIDGNVEARNDTADDYRYFDATPHAEFLYACVEQTVEEDLPQEVRLREAFDRFSTVVKEIVEMPDRKIEQLHRFLAQAGGHLSKRGTDKEFRALTDDEIARVESLYNELFAGGNRVHDGGASG
jgi:hypothetical protein